MDIDLTMSQSELSRVYTKLSVNFDNNFDTQEKFKLIENYMMTIYSVDIKHIETEKLQKSGTLLNNLLFEILNYCKEHNFKNPAIIYLCFVDFFSLDYLVTYNMLHPKLQLMIKISTQSFIGNSIYRRYVQKASILVPQKQTLYTAIYGNKS